jgi:hypothetical protein
MRQQLAALHSDREEQLAAPVRVAESRLEKWVAERTRLADKRDAAHRTLDLRHVERHAEAGRELAASLQVTGEPGVRVLAVVVPKGEAK